MTRRAARAVDCKLVVSALLSAIALLLVACSGGPGPLGEREARFRIDPSYVARLEDTNAFVALAFPAGASQAVGFLSDGDAGKVGRAGATGEWFVGPAAPPEFDLASRNGVRLQGRVEAERARGAVTFQGGQRIEFTAERARGSEAGLYREEATVGDVGYLLGWIVLNDGKVRGTSYPPYIRCPAVVGTPLLERLLGRVCG